MRKRSSITITQLSAADITETLIEDLNRLTRQLSVLYGYQAHQITSQRARSVLAQAHVTTYIAVVQKTGQCVGLAAVLVEHNWDVDTARLQLLVVEDSYRSKGIGTQLLATAHQSLPPHIEEIDLLTSAQAIDFYEARHYTRAIGTVVLVHRLH